MLKRIFCTIVAVFMAVSCVSHAAMTAIDKEKDVWFEAFKTEQTRLYPNSTAFLSQWPSYSGGFYAGTLDVVIGKEDAKAFGDIYGEDAVDLYFTDIESTNSIEAFIADEMYATNLKYCDMKEWNGFLFVLVCGYKTYYTNADYTDYNGNTKTYSIAARDYYVQNGELDSYLYIFDISRAENYGTALYARLTKADLGYDELPTQVMDKIDIDDNYIYITTNNNAYKSSQGNTSYYNAHGLTVFKNNIKRGETAAVPQRADNAENLPYGARVIQTKDNNRTATANAFNYAYYKSTVINGKHILWYRGKTSLQSGGSKVNESMITVSDIFGEGTGKVYYTTSAYGTSLGDLLTCPEGDWAETTSPMIKAIVNYGNDLYFLVTYTSDANYTVIYKTDWSDPENPTLTYTYKYSFNGDDLTKDTRLFKYGNKIYVSHNLGIDIINANGEYEYTGTILYSSDIFSVKPTIPVRLVVVGDYMYIWSDNGCDYKLCLDETGLAAKSVASSNTAKKKPYDDIIIHGDKIYTPVFQQSPLVYKPCIARIDTEELIPVSVEVEPCENEVIAPYTINGTGTNIDWVYVNDNGITSQIKTTLGEDGVKHWSYKVAEEGTHEIEFTGMLFADYPIYETTEKVTLTAVYTEAGVIYSASETTITAQITLTGAESTEGTAVVAVYSGDELTDVKTCDITNGEAVEFTKPEGDYKVKTFFFDKSGKLNTLYSAVSAEKTEIEG